MARFKKGSAAAKAWGRKMQRARGQKFHSRKTSIKYKGVKKVAKRRSYARARPKRRVRRKSSSLFGLGSAMIGAVAYGAVRAKISNVLIPITSKIPLGSVSDEVGMLITLSLAKKFVGRKVALVGQIATAGTYIELARIGEEIASGNLSFGNANAVDNYFS